MVMTGVVPPLRRRYVNLDTRFRDDYDASVVANYTVTLPEKITKVKTMKVVQAEVPISFNNVSSYLNNCSIVVQGLSGESVVTSSLYTVPNGFYTSASFVTYLGSNTVPFLSGYALDTANHSTFTVDLSGNTSVAVHFSVDASGNFDKYDLKTKLGWLLGFRRASYTFTGSGSWVSEAAVDFTAPRYMYLILDDYQNNSVTGDTSFIAPMYRSIINKNIIARLAGGVIQVNQGAVFSNVYDFNEYTGLTTETRKYSGSGALLQRLQVSLVDEFGRIVDLNGLDFSFCLALDCE
jgi:hypothetical protein